MVDFLNMWTLLHEVGEGLRTGYLIQALIILLLRTTTGSQGWIP